MLIEIKNVGPVKSTSIKCDGLTIVTGKNGSGKSTLAKSITSISYGLVDYKKNFVADYLKEIRNGTDDILKNYSNSTSSLIFKNSTLCKNKLPKLYNLLYSSKKYENENDLIKVLENAIGEINVSKYNSNIIEFENGEIINQLCNYFHKKLDYLSNEDNKYIDCSKYITSKINSLFNFQVKNKMANDDAEINISSYDSEIHYVYKNSTSVLHINGAYPDILYINDGKIIDYLFDKESDKYIEGKINKKSLDNEHVKFDLWDIIPKSITKLLEEVVDYNIYFEGNSLVRSTDRLLIKNEADGKKIFILIKLLIESYAISNNTTLIFDEPENHLHPEYQNIFSKLILELIKQYNCNIIVITHSPTMLLALDKYANTNLRKVYYFKNENNILETIDCSNKIEYAHSELNKAYLKIHFGDYDDFN